MQLIFKYDIDRLLSYSADENNKIYIADKDSFMMLSFPEVDYFNYAFTLADNSLSDNQLSDIEQFYLQRGIAKHKVIVNANCHESNKLLANHKGYQHVTTIAKTGIAPTDQPVTSAPDGLNFVKADHSNIDLFTRLYLKSFESEKDPDSRIVSNFKSLLKLRDLDLYMLKKEDKYVGVNVLYQSQTESLLAGGAILPEHRNKGFHLQSLKFRINKAVNNHRSKHIVAWAYHDSVSLKNMLKLKMKVQENFNVYEYSR